MAEIPKNLPEELDSNFLKPAVEKLESNIPAPNDLPPYESLGPVVEYPDYPQSQEHIRQVVEERKQNYQPIKPVSGKLNKEHIWLENLEEGQRVEISMRLILTKAKDMLEVIHSFLEIGDYVGLDRLEEALSAKYDVLVSENILKG